MIAAPIFDGSGKVVGYTMQVPPNATTQVANPDPIESKMTDKMLQELHYTRIRQSVATARNTELRLLLDSLNEVRAALSQGCIGDDDTGTGERPPLQNAFNHLNHDRLQNAYLSITERVVNYIDDMVKRDLKIEVTNELKKP